MTPRSSSGWPSGCRLRVTVTPYPLEQADQALSDLAEDRVTGAAVLTVSAIHTRARESAQSQGKTAAGGVTSPAPT